MSRRVHDLEEQLAQLEWRKLQNARRINEILGNIKQQQEIDTKASTAASSSAITERSKWAKEIEKDEYSKPLRLPHATIKKLRAEKTAQKERECKVGGCACSADVLLCNEWSITHV